MCCGELNKAGCGLLIHVLIRIASIIHSLIRISSVVMRLACILVHWITSRHMSSCTNGQPLWYSVYIYPYKDS